MNPICLDIECVKEPVSNWVHKYRFRTVVIGLGHAGTITQLYDDDEEKLFCELIAYLQDKDPAKTEILYEATRDFDIMVLAGLWTSARRPHAEKPGPWPHLDLRILYETRNLKPNKNRPTRQNDVAGKDVPWFWKNGYREEVFRHNWLDVHDMMERIKS